MKRIFSIILLALTPILVNAFGLGKLDLNSALNEPFAARIQILASTADELDSLKINLADSDAFTRAKIDRPFILSKLRFELRSSVDDGSDYIRVYSQAPIREPFLNFLIEVSWSNGRLFREYTVLLDPPLYHSTVRANEFDRVTDSGNLATAAALDDPDHKVVYEEEYEQLTNLSTSSIPNPTYGSNANYTGGDYGSTTKSDTLWSIASKMRPDRSISVNQMMLALLRANPDVFINQNINGLKRGKILRAPNENEINALSSAEALAEVQSHHRAWSNFRENFSSNVSDRPEISSISEAALSATEEMIPDETAPSEAKLKLVSANDETEATKQQISSVDSSSGEELVLAQETIQVLTQENIELKDRIRESESLLEDLERLLSLKDDELAALQKQMVAATTEKEITEVMELKPEPDSVGIMGIVNEYIGKTKEIFVNLIVVLAVIATFIALIIAFIKIKSKKEPVETVHIDALTEKTFSGSVVGDTAESVHNSEAADLDLDIGDDENEITQSMTVDEIAADALIEEASPSFVDDTNENMDNSEAANFDLDIDDDENEITQSMTVDEVVADFEERSVEEEEYPLQEVDTYLAFAQFDQAEEFARNAINDDPKNPEYHTKLLEVFYTSRNKKSYEESAKELHNIVDGKGEYWDIATAMWQEMSPNRALFETGADGDDEPNNNIGDFINVTVDEEGGDDSGNLDIDRTEEILVTEETSSIDDVLDISVKDGNDLLDVTATTSPDVDSSALLDFEIDDLTIDAENVAKSEANDIKSDILAETNETIEFDLAADEGKRSTDDDNIFNIELEISEPDDSSLDDDIELDLSLEEADFNLDTTVESPKNVLSSTEENGDNDDHIVFFPKTAQPEEQNAEDVIATKLDLAKAYVEVGDKDSANRAKNLLDEVMAEGNDEQRKQAEDLLEQV